MADIQLRACIYVPRTNNALGIISFSLLKFLSSRPLPLLPISLLTKQQTNRAISPPPTVPARRLPSSKMKNISAPLARCTPRFEPWEMVEEGIDESEGMWERPPALDGPSGAMIAKTTVARGGLCHGAMCGSARLSFQAAWVPILRSLLYSLCSHILHNTRQGPQITNANITCCCCSVIYNVSNLTMNPSHDFNCYRPPERRSILRLTTPFEATREVETEPQHPHHF